MGNETLFYGIGILAILSILYGLWQAISLRRQVPGGVVGRQWKILTWLVLLFAVGYAAIPFFGRMPIETLRLVVVAIFLGGAIYVVITIRLIHTIIRALSD
ncbi:hypothetical protein [Thermomonas flagellata]|uniref:hypothetical protein n=1 Tax=Thermomonas flagellata TaxID=2888524 RepID=UPI001F03D0E6|nr:hypothetical protein [Thermomonas flagellata]